MIMRTRGLPQLRDLHLDGNHYGLAGLQALCEGLGRETVPSLLHLSHTRLGPAGAEALSAALRRGALPQLELLWLMGNPIGKQGMAALAPALRNLSALASLHLAGCDVGDEGVASLVANLGKDDFKKLEDLFLVKNNITDTGGRALVSAFHDGVPALVRLFWTQNPCSEAARKAVEVALAGRNAARLRRLDEGEGGTA